MSFPNSNGFTGGPAGSGQAAPSRGGKSSSVSLALDNLLRNHLRVNDPRNAKQVADGLLAYYQDHPQAVGIRQEVIGIPNLPVPYNPTAPVAATRGSSDTEFSIANGDVERALQDLTSNPLTNDITPEMQGWADSIRTAINQGHSAARHGLDPTQRDKVIAVRRQLNEYARLARFVGSLSPGMTQNFRRLGRALDETTAVLLVMLGESLASVGFATGYYMLQVPLPELQQRRDSVIFALRNFNGGSQQSYDPDMWPRGIDAYRRVYNWLEQQGQGDLRSLLIENELAGIMDTLITRAQNGTAEGLRALGVTAQLDIERFRRMAIVAPGALMREDGGLYRSPPLEAFLQALDLFAQTFKTAGGLRLLHIARPPVLFYGLYNTSQIESDTMLFDLVAARGMLATIFDGLFPANTVRGVQPQVLLDMLLMELDRGIDLLALGGSVNEDGAAESRAWTFWLIVQVIYDLLMRKPQRSGGPLPDIDIETPIGAIYHGDDHDDKAFKQNLDRIARDYQSAITNVPGLDEAFRRLNKLISGAPPSDRKLRTSMAEEFRVQRSLEKRWENLVRTIAPEAGDQQSIFGLLSLIIAQAAHRARIDYLPPYAPPLPPQFEETLDEIVKKISPPGPRGAG